MKKLSLASLAGLALLTAASANAADRGPAYKAPPPVAAPAPWTWTGFYIGVHIGAGWGDKIWSEPAGSSVNCEDCLGGSGTTAGLVDADGTVAGFLGGGQIGFNLQILPNWVAGVEADVSGADIRGNFPCFGGQHAIVQEASADSCHSKSDVLGTIVGRVGPTIGPAWIYVLGGGAWIRDHYSDDYFFPSSFCPSGFCTTYSASETRWGWTVGTGVEYAIGANWSAKVQYNFMDFGTTRELLFIAPGSVDLGCAPCQYKEDIQQRIHTVKFGINYRWNWGKAPLMARY
jgi:outer membrane immunogenic protein